MLIRSPRLPIRMAFDPIAVGAKQLVVARDTSERRSLQVFTDAIEMGQPYAMASSQFRATTAAHVVNLQGSNVRAPLCTVSVMPTTVGIATALSERRHDLATQYPLPYGALTLSHVYIILRLQKRNLGDLRNEKPGHAILADWPRHHARYDRCSMTYAAFRAPGEPILRWPRGNRESGVG